MTSFGDHLRQLRVGQEITLRQFCSDNDIDPGNLSRIERGRLSPPSNHQTLVRWAKALGLREASPQWIEFFDLAAIAAGRLPADIKDDEAVLSKLPLLFRTLRNEQVSLDSLAELIEMVKKD